MATVRARPSMRTVPATIMPVTLPAASVPIR